MRDSRPTILHSFEDTKNTTKTDRTRLGLPLSIDATARRLC